MEKIRWIKICNKACIVLHYMYAKILLDGGPRTRRYVPGHYEHGVIERYLFTVQFISFDPRVHGIVKSVSAFSHCQCGEDRRDDAVFRRRRRHNATTTMRRSETATKTRAQHDCSIIYYYDIGEVMDVSRGKKKKRTKKPSATDAGNVKNGLTMCRPPHLHILMRQRYIIYIYIMIGSIDLCKYIIHRYSLLYLIIY